MSSLKDKRSSRTEALAAAPATRPADLVIGTLVGLGDDGAPLVDFAGNPAGAPVRAMATARYSEVAPGSAVALMFLDSDRARPLAIGVIPGQADAAPVEQLMFTAEREIVLKCGRASIVLTRAGKVLVRGAYLSLRSFGMQRITGASVQIN